MYDERCKEIGCDLIHNVDRSCNPDTCYLIKKDDPCPDCGGSMSQHNWWCKRAKHCQFKGKFD